jgi:outer membrane receptor protein involved in Fe transport
MRFSRPTAALFGVSLIALASPAMAQDQVTAQAGAAAADEAEVETIIVTGSRLARDMNAISPLPVSTVGAADLRAAGNTDAAATLRQLPALLSSSTVADSLLRGEGTAEDSVGVAALDLRQLGAERTLVLVDGRRHVSGIAGAATVDVSTIPQQLIERVDVLTGGASAVYGADAVTGVVNFVLKRDFEGIELDAQSGISSRGDGSSFRINGIYGRNFADGRGNVTLAAGYTLDSEVLLGDRGFTADNGRFNNSRTYANPDRRFQKGDINPSTMPNFASFFTLAEGRYPYGFSIPTAAQIAEDFPGGITAAERALVDRAANAPLFKLGADPRFAISSGEGLLWRGDFGFFNADTNNNGTGDCDESYIGSFAFGFGGACYVTTPGGGVRIFNDGIISTGSNQFGGDGAIERTNATSLVPRSERYYVNLRSQFEVSSAVELFVDAKWARSETKRRNNYNSFYDSLYIYPDNPWIPTALAADAADGGGLRVSRDMLDLGPGITRTDRDTYRIVGGARGELGSNLKYDFGLNWGRTDSTSTFSNAVLPDRLFAALDAVRAPNGQIVCRSDLDPNALHPGSEFFPIIRPGNFTFRPGDGTCRPANILAGSSSISQDAVNFITVPTTDRYRTEQFVGTLAFTGDSGKYFELPGGPVQFAAGGEYRREISRTTFDPLTRGILPGGQFIGDVPQGQVFVPGSPGAFDPNQINLGLVFDGQARIFNGGGSFDVWELFGEINVPLLKDRPFFEELSLSAAGRYADYSTIGGAFTWNINGVWAPVSDIRFRAGYSQAIRAPNVNELFEPPQGATFRPDDPCNQSTLDALAEDGAANAATRLANCRADGIPAGYEDPLSARFSGTSGGNPDLKEETARTWNVGVVVQPRFVPGLTLSADWYNIEIQDAIQAVQSQDIVDTCYDLSTFPNQYCDLFSRNRNPLSQTFLGFNFLRQTQINFGRLETAGLDLTAAYGFSLGDHNFNLRAAATYVDKLNRFFDPIDTSLADPGLRELGAPQWAGSGSISWGFRDVSLTWRLQYIGEQGAAAAVQIEQIDTDFGPAGLAPAYWLHDLNFNIDATEQFSFYGGVNNLTDARPFPASTAFPVSGVGRFFYIGARARF